MRSVEFYAVIGPSKRYGNWYPQILRTKKRSPKLKAGEIAIQIKLELPDEWQQPATLPIRISENQIQRPIAKAL
jgi:hypothetical protein